MTLNLSAQVIMRAPASSPLDEDLILAPLDLERTLYDEFNEKHKAAFSASRKQIDHWIALEQYAQDYGLDDTHFINLPSAEEKEFFFHKVFF